jgi:glycerol uptake facilitator-like aquaporin
MNKYIAEFIGTFFLVLTVGCTVIGLPTRLPEKLPCKSTSTTDFTAGLSCRLHVASPIQ